jgi:hypothetical protein
MKIDIASALLTYFNQCKLLEEKGGPEQDGDLFEEVLAKEEEILSAFGLPGSLKFCKVLHKLSNRKSVTAAAIRKTIGSLQQAAQKYHNRPVVSSVETLTLAQQKKLNAFDVLPELGFITHTYTVFLYDDLLLERKAAPAAILKELQILHEQDLYGPVARLHFNLKPAYRRTKAYKALKAQLQFLDLYLASEVANGRTKDPGEEVVYPAEVVEALLSGIDSSPGHPEVPANPKDCAQESIVLTDLVMMEEIMFSADSAVTVTGRISFGADGSKPITLGFEFAELIAVILAYRKRGQSVLNYFNRDRQKDLFDEPVVINLKDKTGSDLLLDRHYFKVYKPLSLNREGNPTPMEEDFYLVEEIIDKYKYDEREVNNLKQDLEGYFHHMRNHYYAYLNHKHEGMDEKAARKRNDLEDDVRFKVSRLLYRIWKHGGKP